MAQLHGLERPQKQQPLKAHGQSGNPGVCPPGGTKSEQHLRGQGPREEPRPGLECSPVR